MHPARILHGVRVLMLLLCVGCLAPPMARADVVFPDVRAGVALEFPRDHGSHPAFRTEWWYITGWLRGADGREFGVQITFFRHRTGLQEDNPSRFAPTQLIFAHAAVTDAAAGRLRHDQRAARAGFGLAHAMTGDTDLRIGQWTLQRATRGYHARIAAAEFDLDMSFAPTQPPLLQGDAGFSRKGRLPRQASHYYSVPQLSAQGTLVVTGKRMAVTGRAWLDHEWSSEYLAPSAQGWDWAGINLDDGGAVMAFRMRDAGGASLWAGGTHRDAQGKVRVLGPGEIAFTPLRQWRSPRTGTRYPVAMQVRAGDLTFDLVPLMDDQELDARASTATLYWEGAVRATLGGRPVGRGYLELTGYHQRPRL